MDGFMRAIWMKDAFAEGQAWHAGRILESSNTCR